MFCPFAGMVPTRLLIRGFRVDALFGSTMGPASFAGSTTFLSRCVIGYIPTSWPIGSTVTLVESAFCQNSSRTADADVAVMNPPKEPQS